MNEFTHIGYALRTVTKIVAARSIQLTGYGLRAIYKMVYISAEGLSDYLFPNGRFSNVVWTSDKKFA